MHVLVLVLWGPVDDLDLVVVHQNAPGHRALALPVVLRRTEHREYTTTYTNKEKGRKICKYMSKRRNRNNWKSQNTS